jgi:hypothetical protein
MDESGQIISWTLVQLSQGDLAGSEVDIALNIGGKVKLIPNFQLDLKENYPAQNPFTYEIDFSPTDPNTYMVCSDNGLFKGNRFNH